MTESQRQTRGISGTILVLAAWTLPWALLVFHLRTFWTLAPDYEYGWLVPPLALYFLFRRWTSTALYGNGNGGAATLAGASALFILPIWCIRDAVPDWSVVNYSLTAAVIVYTLALVANRTSWATAQNVAFPICFILCAVPWPQRAENAIIQNLARAIAAVAVEALQWLGIGAVRHGNLVSLGTGTVGISDACSGIRSLQSMLVAALTIGELYLLSLSRRIALLGASFSIALALNLVRNIALVLIASRYGMAALEHWHDRAGWAILLLSLPPIFLLGRRWQTTQHPPSAGRWITSRPLPTWIAGALTVWFCLVAGGVEAWYRAHERGATTARHLQVHWPAEKMHFSRAPLDDRTRDVLLCSEGQSASWAEADGTRWILTSITWAPGQTSAQSARVHRPEVCYQATGAQFLAKLPRQKITISGGTLLFEPLEFRNGTAPVYVFYCLYEEANHDDPSEFFQTRWTRIHRAFLGQRNLGQQVVELSVRGFADYGSALRAAARQIPAILSLHPAAER